MYSWLSYCSFPFLYVDTCNWVWVLSLVSSSTFILKLFSSPSFSNSSTFTPLVGPLPFVFLLKMFFTMTYTSCNNSWGREKANKNYTKHIILLVLLVFTTDWFLLLIQYMILLWLPFLRIKVIFFFITQ